MSNHSIAVFQDRVQLFEFLFRTGVRGFAFFGRIFFLERVRLLRPVPHETDGAECARYGPAEVPFPRSGSPGKLRKHVPHQPSVEERHQQRDGHQRHMPAQYSTEKQEESQPVDDATGADVPPRLAYHEGEQAAPYPDGKEDVRRYVAIEVKQAPRQEEERDGIGQQVPETAVHQRVREDAEHPAFLHGIDAQSGEIPPHPHLQKLQGVQDEQQKERYGGGQRHSAYIMPHILHGELDLPHNTTQYLTKRL